MPDILKTTDFDLPVTEEFLHRVQRGVRRRQAFRVAAAGLAVLAVTGVVAVTQTRRVPDPVAAASPTIADVDRFLIGYIPDGIRLDEQRGSSSLMVRPDGTDAGTSSGPQDLNVAVSMRRFEQANGGSYMWITVYRPSSPPAQTVPATTFNALLNRQLIGTTTVEKFDVPTGRASLTRTSAAEAAGYGIVIAGTDRTVITIEANTRVPAETLKSVAAGITPA
ncbi:hypothetical protein Q0Z83_053070 [Actinoplanes sichuanensis]|uniref:DUF4367 domain-containing protein n=1 Tax=Actinoplanes sichuanensis TaxID=512349 RepID=A0ABW4AS48_9ACTN|nr:hypothetical protein [Actinoplanes sichuanensis]BEL07116.1 hypothetical protein Q0Z83_053070 [Actinoplanes sichuanensis]